MTDNTTQHAIYPVYLCHSRTFKRMDGTLGTDVYEQDVVAFAPTYSMATAYASKLNDQHAHTYEVDGESRRVYFTCGNGRTGIVSLPKAIKLVG